MDEIFISYKREEQDIARRLARALEARGWSVWWDPKLRAGENFDDVIEQAIREAKCVIVLWSARSKASRYIRDEARLGLDLEKLLPVAIEHVEPPMRYRPLHTIQLQTWDGSALEPAFQELVKCVEHKVGRPRAAATDDAIRRLADPDDSDAQRHERHAPPLTPPSDVDDQEDVAESGEESFADEILTLLQEGNLEAVSARLGVPVPVPWIFPEQREGAAHGAKGLIISSDAMPTKRFEALLEELVEMERSSGFVGITQWLHDLVAQGGVEVARRVINLFMARR
jgi:TIR domain